MRRPAAPVNESERARKQSTRILSQDYHELQYKPWQGRLLMCTSTFFAASSAVSALSGSYGNAACMGGASLASVNYWRAPGPSWRRDLDLAMAAIAFVYGFIGACSLQGPPNVVTWTSFVGAGVCVRCSWVYSARNGGGDGSWALWHAGSHASLATAGACIGACGGRWPPDPAWFARASTNAVAAMMGVTVIGGILLEVLIKQRQKGRSWLQES